METIKELLDYLRSMPKEFIVLVNVRAEDYLKVNLEILKGLANDNKIPGVYITVNKPYRTMKKLLDDNKVNSEGIYFIDCISSSSGWKEEGMKNVFFLDSPQNLTGLGIAMNEAISAIGDTEKFLFMDSLSTLLLYHNAGTVAKFSHFLTGKMRLWGLRGVLMSVERGAEPELTAQLSQFCDAVLTLGGDNPKKGPSPKGAAPPLKKGGK